MTKYGKKCTRRKTKVRMNNENNIGVKKEKQ